jgi:hypothetical protein
LADTDVFPALAPSDDGVAATVETPDASVELVLYSKTIGVVDNPLSLTLPFSVTVVPATAPAAEVVTKGPFLTLNIKLSMAT